MCLCKSGPFFVYFIVASVMGTSASYSVVMIREIASAAERYRHNRKQQYKRNKRTLEFMSVLKLLPNEKMAVPCDGIRGACRRGVDGDHVSSIARADTGQLGFDGYQTGSNS